MKDQLRLMSASGRTTCEYSMVHDGEYAVGWIEIETLGLVQRYLACAACTDLHAKRGLKVLKDVRRCEDTTCPGDGECGMMHEGDGLPVPYIVPKDHP